MFVTGQGLMEGVGEGRFDPSGTITRGQIVTILHSLEGKPAVQGEMTFTDVPEGEWYAGAVRWAASKGVVAGRVSLSR